MPLEEPSWWYAAQGQDWRQRALAPAASLFGWAVQRRFAKAEPYRASLPVICVGNFTAGGTGKTPLSLRIAELITATGGRPAVLSRGYGGSAQGPLLVDRSQHSADVVGDEPLLLAAHAPTLICRNRATGAQAIEALSPRPTHIIMDDGLQNPLLVKDLTIAVVDGSRGLGNGAVIPAGPLRAPLGFQLDRTQAIVVNIAASPQPGELPRSPVLDYLRTHFHGPVLAAWAEPVLGSAGLQGRRVVAFAGIGNPDRFFSLLKRQGAEMAAAVSFKDHHRFTEQDAARLLTLAADSNAQLMTTEKDLARLAGRTEALAELRAASEALAIRLCIEPRDEKRLAALIEPLGLDLSGRRA